MQHSILYYLFLIPFLYALIAMPIPNGAWQEYVLLGTSLSMAFFTFKEQGVIEPTNLFKALIIVAFSLGVYAIIFYIKSDWSVLETTSLILLCIPSLVTFVRFLLVDKNN